MQSNPFKMHIFYPCGRVEKGETPSDAQNKTTKPECVKIGRGGGRGGEDITIPTKFSQYQPTQLIQSDHWW